MPPKYEEPKEEQPEIKPEEGQPPIEGEQPAPADGEKPPGEEAPPAAEEVPDQPGMDLGIGEQPEEPEDEPPEDLPDKLKPKNPIFVEAIKADNEKKYKEGYMFYKGNETKE